MSTSDLRLFETMRVLPDGRIPLLERHLSRLTISARDLSFRCEAEKLRDAVLRGAPRTDGLSWLRLTLSKNGGRHVESGPFVADNPKWVRISSYRVNSQDALLYHKTSHRDVYDAARREFDHDTEALLVNERGEITEITIANVAVLRGGQWITPKLSCGLLGGVMRADLLERGEIVEGIIRADQLAAGEVIRCFNALRGIFDASLSESSMDT